MLLTQDRLLDRLQELLGRSQRVDMAVAWSSPGSALRLVTEFGAKRPGHLRAVVGITGNVTHPMALHSLNRCGRLRISVGGPLFHPKLYLFHHGDGTTGWIGSANLTRGGFEQNIELVSEFEDDGTATAWFDEAWAALDADPSKTIEAYESAWVFVPNMPIGEIGVEKAPTKVEVGHWADGFNDWASFVMAFDSASKYWTEHDHVSADGDTASWLNTISLGNEIMWRQSWYDLSWEDYRLIIDPLRK